MKSLSALLRGRTSNHKGEFYCLNCFHSYSAKEKVKKYEKVCNDHDYRFVEIPNDDNKILKNNHREKSLKAPFMIYADLECLLEKMHSYENNPEKSYAEKKTKHTIAGYLLLTNCSFDLTKSKPDYYKEEHSMERFCKDLREHAMKIIDYQKKKKMIPLTDKDNVSYEKQKVCYICKKEFSTDENDKNAFKLYHKVRDHCHYTGKFRGAAHSICNLRYKVPKIIPIVFHNGSTYDYHFIIKQLAEDFKGQFECLGENTEKYITFSVPIKKELDNSKTITYKLKFIDSFRFMSTPILSLVENSSLDYMITQDDQLIFRCFECIKNYQKDFNNN